MRKIIFTTIVCFQILCANAQQNLVLAPNYNSNKPFVDKQGQMYNFQSPMRFRELNDSTILYYGNMRDQNWSSQNQQIFIRTFKTNKIDDIHVNDYFDILVEDFNSGPPLYNAEITDVLINASKDIFVIQNDYQSINVHKYIYDANGGENESGAYKLSWTKQSNNNPRQESAKAYLTSDSKVILFALQNFRDISRIEISADGQSISASTLVNNNGDTISKIGDVKLMSDGSVVIADNSYIQTQGNVQQLNRVIKLKANGTIDQDFGVNGIMYLHGLNVYNLQFNNIYESASINKIAEDNGKILVVGFDAELNNAGFPIKKGFIYKFNSDGTSDNTFSEDGIYNPSLQDFGYQNFQFNDIQKTNNGKYLIFGGGRKVVLGNIGLICSINSSNGTEDNSIGNAGKVFENKYFTNIHHAKILYSQTGNIFDASIYVMGLTDSSFVFSNNGGFLQTTATAKMVWKNTNSTRIEGIINNPTILIYPNPCQNYFVINSPQNTFINLYSTDGNLINTFELNGENRIDVSYLSPGIYFLKTSKGQISKFIKE